MVEINRGKEIEIEKKNKRKSRVYFALLLGVLLIAAALRLAGLTQTPPGVEHDEAAEVLIARDIQGGQHALFFQQAYGQEPLFLYLMAGALAAFGENLVGLRFVSAAVGLLTVAVGARLARRLFGPKVGLVTAGGLGVMLWPVFWSRVGLRGMTLPLLSSLGADAIWQAIQSTSPAEKRRYGLLSGLFFGLSAYTYLAARGLPILLGLFVIYLLLFNRVLLRRNWRTLTLTLAVAGILALPLIVYLASHPEVQYRVGEVNAPLVELSQGKPGAMLSNIPLVPGMFSFRGDSTPRNNFPNRPVFPEPVWAALFYIGLLVALARLRDARYGFVLIWLGVMLTPTLVTTEAPNFVRALGALPAAMMLPGIGVKWIYDLRFAICDPSALLRAGLRFAIRDLRSTSHKSRVTDHESQVTSYESRLPIPNLQSLISILLSLVLVLNAGLTVRDYFVRWPQLHETQFVWQTNLAAIARSLDADPQKVDVTLAGLSNDSMDAPSLALLLRRKDVHVRWVDTGSPLSTGGALVIPQSGGWLMIPSIVPLNPSLAEQLSAWGARRMERAYFTEFWIPSPVVAENTPISFEANVSLLKAEAPDELLAPGQTLTLLTIWQAGAPSPPPLKAFIHVVDASGVLRAQHDGLDSPAQFWHPGDVIVQVHSILLPADLAPGDYTLRLGVYNRDTLTTYRTIEGQDSFTAGAIRVYNPQP